MNDDDRLFSTIQPIYHLSYGDYVRFRDLVQERSGLYFSDKKRADLEQKLLKLLADSTLAPAQGNYNLDGYYNLLADKHNPAGRLELERLIKSLTVNETYFFRDEAQFDALAGHVLPNLIAHKRAMSEAVGAKMQPQLRIWSAGCASGEEAYSVAMLLRELLPDLNKWMILILATDINEDVLKRGREGIYSDWSFREARAKQLRARYFSPEGETNHYRLREEIRRMVTFAPLNLVEDTYPAIHNNTSAMDLILCRNVMIYFNKRTTRWVISRFYEALAKGGWLIVGHSEPSLSDYRDFKAHSFPGALLYQKVTNPDPWPDNWNWLKLEPPADLNDSSPTTALPEFLEQTETAPLPGGEGAAIELPWAGGEGLLVAAPDPYEEAIQLLAQGQVKEAIAELQRKVADTPNFAPAHSLLGRAYANMGRWHEAQRWCQSALKLDSLSAEAYYVLALVYQHEDQNQPAISMLKKAIYLERDAPLPHFNLASLYKKTGQIEEAKRACRNLLKILEKWPPDQAVPDSGGATATHLIETTRWMLNKLDHHD
jgi:chemotaxis protein methyltransferase CheR